MRAFLPLRVSGWTQVRLDQSRAVLRQNCCFNRFTENAKKLSGLYRDRHQDPLATAVYWTEYVARNRVHLLLKPSTQHLRWYEYCLLDVFIAVTATAVAAAYLAKRLFAKKKHSIKLKHQLVYLREDENAFRFIKTLLTAR